MKTFAVFTVALAFLAGCSSNSSSSNPVGPGADGNTLAFTVNGTPCLAFVSSVATSGQYVISGEFVLAGDTSVITVTTTRAGTGAVGFQQGNVIDLKVGAARYCNVGEVTMTSVAPYAGTFSMSGQNVTVTNGSFSIKK